MSVSSNGKALKHAQPCGLPSSTVQKSEPLRKPVEAFSVGGYNIPPGFTGSFKKADVNIDLYNHTVDGQNPDLLGVSLPVTFHPTGGVNSHLHVYPMALPARDPR